MRRTMNLWILAGALVVVLAGFLWFNGHLNQTLEELTSVSEANTMRISNLENEQTELESMLASAGTEAFIENQARTKHDYMMPDEIRFVIEGLETENDEEMPSP